MLAWLPGARGAITAARAVSLAGQPVCVGGTGAVVGIVVGVTPGIFPAGVVAVVPAGVVLVGVGLFVTGVVSHAASSNTSKQLARAKKNR